MDRLFQMVCSSLCYSKSSPDSLSLIFFDPLLMKVFPHYIVPYDPFLAIVHLFIIQLCTQVYVLMNCFFGFLQVVVVENTVQMSSSH